MKLVYLAFVILMAIVFGFACVDSVKPGANSADWLTVSFSGFYFFYYLRRLAKSEQQTINDHYGSRD